MLKPAVVAEIKLLLAAGGLSQRAIAKKTGVSRAKVHEIAQGKRPDYEARRLESAAPAFGGPFVRCTDCGRLVQLPCLACHLLALDQAGLEISQEDPEGPIRIELTGQAKERYQKLLAEHRQADPIVAAGDEEVVYDVP